MIRLVGKRDNREQREVTKKDVQQLELAGFDA